MDEKPKMEYVPEVILKKRKINEKKAIENARKRREQKKAKKSLKTEFKTAASLIKRQRDKELQLRRFRALKALQAGKMTGKHKLEQENPKELLLVIRTQGDSHVYHKVNEALRELRLLYHNNGVFIRKTKKNVEYLRILAPFVVYGAPTLETVRDLILKRAFVNIKGQRTPLSDNTLIEEKLGEYGIICVEDIIHEIYTVGEHFDKVTQFLFPFRLSSDGANKHEKRFKEYSDKLDKVAPITTDVNKMVAALN